MVTLSKSLTKNHLLSALPEDEYLRLLPDLESIELAPGKVLYEIGDAVSHLYFPSGALISLVTQMADGKIVEVGLIGNDGVSGVSNLMGRKTSYERALVQIPNGGFRIRLTKMQEEFDKGQTLQKSLLYYMTSLMRQVSQTAACNASHPTEERLSRWLLMCADRIGSTDLNLTQEFLAEMLGTKRATVNVAAKTLQSSNLIHYRRGHINIIDRPGLEAFSCECYGILKKSNDEFA
jgi:CRP-like cAMP-binding protein